MKADESSIIVAFRALVMLACLIVAPLAAVFGSAFPDLVRAALVEPFFARKKEPAANGADSSAPQFQPPVGADGLAPSWQPPGTTGPSPAVDAAPRFGEPTPSGFASGASRPASANLARFDAPADPAPAPILRPLPAYNAPAQYSPPSAPSASAGYGGLRGPEAAPAPANTTMDSAPRFLPPGYSPPSAAAPPAAARGTGDTEQFGWFEKKLRDYGATYYLLETWGNEGEFYRFHCKMAVANNPNYTRHFEATDRDKLQAMAHVLEQVEAWRAGRLP